MPCAKATERVAGDKMRKLYPMTSSKDFPVFVTFVIVVVFIAFYPQNVAGLEKSGELGIKKLWVRQCASRKSRGHFSVAMGH